MSMRRVLPLLVVLCAAASAQTTISVPGDAPDLITAYALAGPEDTILVAPGTWVQPTVAISTSVTIRGLGEPEDTVLVSATGGSLFHVVGASPSLILERLTISGTSGVSAAVIVQDGALWAWRCRFENNLGLGFGGAVSALALNQDVSVEFASCEFEANYAALGGAVIGAQSLTAGRQLWLTFESCILTGNASGAGAALVHVDALGAVHCRFANSTVWLNAAGPGGVALTEVLAGSNVLYDLAVTNSIVRGNLPTALGALVVAGFGSTMTKSVSFSDVEGGEAGVGNFDLDPLFVDAGTGDFRLQPTSPCLDSGGWFPFATFTDAGGESRLYGPGLDVGATEFSPALRLRGSRLGLDAEFFAYSLVGPVFPLCGEGDFVQILLQRNSPLVANCPLALVGQISLQGNRPPSPDGFPEVHVNPDVGMAPFILLPPELPATGPGVAATFPQFVDAIPFGLSGYELVVQAFALTPAAPNGFFVASDAYVLPVF
ncbi:MAG: choice-of-anchor Q domain-containing protein [Planctomycetota bacterium]